MGFTSKRFGAWRVLASVFALAIPIGSLVAPAMAADTSPPRILGATMRDTNGDGRADRLELVYNEKIRHRADDDGRYPFSVTGPAYGIRRVGAAAGSKTLIILLQQKSQPDPAARPDVSYTRGKPKPVRDLAGNEARTQTFEKTVPLPCPANTTTDFYANPVVNRAGMPAPTGISSPAWCAFPTITSALASLEAAGGAGRVVAAGAGSGPAVFARETFPLAIDDGMLVTTADEPDLGGAGLDPTRYEIRFKGAAPTALQLDGGTVKGVTFKSARSSDASEMVLCASGAPELQGVALDGSSTAGGEITRGLAVQSGCALSDGVLFEISQQLGLRVRNFAGPGVDVAAGGSVTLSHAKIHANGGDGLWIRGNAQLQGGQVAFNGDDGVFVDQSASSSFEWMVVRDNGASGFEVNSSGLTAFESNQIYNNSRSAGWTVPQLLFSGSPTSGVWTFAGGNDCALGYPVGGGTDQCNPATGESTGTVGECDTSRNAIFGYNVSDSGSSTSVGLRAEGGAVVNAEVNEWASSVAGQNVSASPDSVVSAGVTCGIRLNQEDTSTTPVDYDGS